MTQGNGFSLSTAQRAVLQSAQTTLNAARASVPQIDPHRSLLRARFTVATFIEMLLVVAIPVAMLTIAKPQLMLFWQTVIGWWAERLNMPLALANHHPVDSATWLVWNGGGLWPTNTVSMVTGIIVLIAFAGTFWMPDRWLPFKYVVRILCTVQASASVFFLLLPKQFPYDITSHLSSMLNAGYVLMVTLPVLLALGWGVLRLPLHQKLLFPVLIEIYFAVMLPHKALLQAVFVQHFSLLIMPMLYLCFGAVFDLMLFVALYSWLASRAPETALNE